MIKTLSINDGSTIENCNLVIYLPDAAPRNSPAFIFIPGVSGFGSDINKLYLNGPLQFIKGGWTPPFIVAAAQPSQASGAGRKGFLLFMGAVLKELLDGPYGIDSTRVYFTGQNDGTAVIYDYIQMETDALFKAPAAIIPVSMNSRSFNGKESLSGNNTRFRKIPFLGYGSSGDPGNSLQSMARYVALLGRSGGVGSVITYPEGYENGDLVYDPNGSYNIYDRALQYRVGSTTLAPVKVIVFVSTTYTYSDGTTETIERP